MNDIVYDARLWLNARPRRDRAHWQDCHLAHGHTECLVRKLLDEIELLKGYRDNAESDAAIARVLVDRYRMTDEEREAVEAAYSKLTTDARYTAVAVTLRGLLERTATPPAPNGHAPRGSGSQPVGAAGCATAGREGRET